jgi:hypothetical protein
MKKRNTDALSAPLSEVDTRQLPEVDRLLFYRDVPHMASLVFAPPELAENGSQIRRAFAAKTWGEFQALMPEDDLKSLLKSRYENAWGDLFVILEPDDPFDAEDICAAYFDGDYPYWLQKAQDIWLPNEIIEHWSEEKLSTLNGHFWVIDPQWEQEIVQCLREQGIGAQRRDDLYFF